MNRLYSLILTVMAASLLCPLNMKAQGNDRELTRVLTYMKRAMLYNENMPQEKVYLHFDNTGYFKGETIWFKAYVVRADNVLPTDMSKVVYVELVNPSGDVIQTRKLPVKDGVAHGDIALDSIFGSGFYEVRAYTRYMTNWGSGGVFSRVFPVFDAPEKDGDYSKMVIENVKYSRRLPNIRSNDEAVSNVTEQTSRKLCVHFYPEGGHMVKGLPSRVAFLLTDKSGASKELGGKMLDANKQEIGTVAKTREGRGSFMVDAEGSVKYLRIEDEKGKLYDFAIPEPEDEGMTMNLDMLNDDVITAHISVSSGLQGRLLGYTLIHNGKVILADTLSCAPEVILPFDRKSMPAGVSQLTLFTSDGHIQAERQFFICPKSSEEDTIHVTSPTAYPKPCGKVVLNVKAQPNSSISLSAMDAATMVNGREGNALTWLLLSSDVKGYIADPDYYFEADDRQHRHDADLLMMVQGWRRYDWSLMADAVESNEGYSLFNEETSKFSQPIEDKLYLFGQLRQKSAKHPVSNVWLETYLYNSLGYKLKGTTRTDSLGNYAFSLPDVDGEWTMFVNTGVADKEGYWKDVNYYVGINRHFSPNRRLLSPDETKTVNLLAPNLFNDEKTKKASEADHVYVPIQKREHVLPTVVVKAHRRIFEGARASWESEDRGRHYASLYYNADVDADKYGDMGMVVPTIYSWLNKRNPFFSRMNSNENLTESSAAEEADANAAASTTASLGDISGDMINENDQAQMEEMSSTSEKGLNGEDLNAGVFETTAKQHRIFMDGLGYKNRPIVWILNNTYAAITHLGSVGNFSTFEVLQPCVEDLPIYIDEIKSVYVSENPNAWTSYLLCPDLRGKNVVTMFVYTHYNKLPKAKGVRKTHFQGYNVPNTFTMEDYSVLPPMEDFRRTIYWAPDVMTDASGNASVEFWNNSSCHEMYISAEGLTPNGRFMVNE